MHEEHESNVVDENPRLNETQVRVLVRGRVRYRTLIDRPKNYQEPTKRLRLQPVYTKKKRDEFPWSYCSTSSLSTCVRYGCQNRYWHRSIKSINQSKINRSDQSIKQLTNTYNQSVNQSSFPTPLLPMNQPINPSNEASNQPISQKPPLPTHTTFYTPPPPRFLHFVKPTTPQRPSARYPSLDASSESIPVTPIFPHDTLTNQPTNQKHCPSPLLLYTYPPPLPAPPSSSST